MSHCLLYSVCVHCGCRVCERCRSLPPPQQAVCPTTTCVLSMSGRPLSVGASWQCQMAATLSCEWCSACCHSSCISPSTLVPSACLPQIQCDDRQLLGHTVGHTHKGVHQHHHNARVVSVNHEVLNTDIHTVELHEAHLPRPPP